MKKFSSSIKKLISSAENGDVAAQLEMARRFREGDGVSENLDAAMHWCQRAAEAGNSDAMNDLGSMILNGSGCVANPELAVPWFEKSAEQGNAVAQFNLGLRYLHGSGVTQDDRMARNWIAQSAKQDYPEALGELGTLFRFGRGTERDLVQACELHIQAAQMGDSVAHGNLSNYQDELVEMALAGNRQIAFALSRMYSGGLGVEKDPAKEWAWLRWAHDGCDPLVESEACSSEINRDVADAFEYYLPELDETIRMVGETWLADLLQEAGRLGIHLARPLVVIGNNEGRVELELKGRWFPGGWEFLLESARAAGRYDVDDDNDSINCPQAQEDSSVRCMAIESAESWADALALMDRQPWHKLVPIYVHPELGGLVWEAYEQRWDSVAHKNEPERELWLEVCVDGLQQPDCFPNQTLDEIRREMMERYPGTTIEELEAMGC